ncbi:MAG: polyprenol monophosphomannose synthase [Deltaproteobacteria bacterium]|nr:polyprenol monophosphomannose synthase [Deltaproteobacteria bacterium]
MPEKIAVIPTYNERGNIEKLLPELLDFDPEIEVVVVDDRSPDGTADLAEEIGRARGRVHVVRRAQKEGIGPAYRSGFKKALELGGELIVQMDADFSHPIASLPDFFKNAQEYDLVLGSRYLDGITVVRWPIERLLLSYFGNYYVRKLTGLPVRDTTGGFKCWRRATLNAIDLDQVRSNGYSFQIEMTYRAWCKGARILEVPIIFMDREVGISKMSKRIGLEAMWIVWELKFRRLIGRL